MKVLGYEPGDIVSPHMPAFKQVEERLCELIKTTKDEELRTNFREELARLNEALRVVKSERDREPPTVARGMGTRLVLSLFVVGCVIATAWYANKLMLEGRETHGVRNFETLSVDGRIAVERRNWVRAEDIYRKIQVLEPDSVRARDGFRKIAEGKEEERKQKLAFLLGSMNVGIEQRDWDGAEARAEELLAMEPNHPEVPGLLKRISEGRVFDQIVVLLESAEEAMRDEQWMALSERTKKLEQLAPAHAQLARYKEASAKGMKLVEEGRIRARTLFESALALDKGEFSEAALEALREAVRLDNQKDYQDLYNKMSAYTRLLNVPGDFSTISEALGAARANDKIRVGPGTYKESLSLKVKVNLEGAGSSETIIECEAESASVLLATSEATGSRIGSLSMKQTGISLTDERYPVVVADAAELILEDCHIEHGSGHGVAIINGGTGRLRNVRVTRCGWDGLAVYGEGSRADVADCRFELNFHHGVDAWAGGGVELVKSRSTLNGLAGVVLMSPGVKSVVTQCTLDRNREVGITVSNGAQASLRANRAESNLLGGFIVMGEGTHVGLEGNVAEKNREFGIVVDRRSKAEPFKGNVARGNHGEQLKLQAVMPEEVVAPPTSLEIPPKKPGGPTAGDPK